MTAMDVATRQTVQILNVLGASDADTGRVFGKDRSWARRRRVALGLPPNHYNAIHRAKLRRSLARFLADNGCKTFAEFRALCHRVNAASKGWPSDLWLPEVQILELLRGGPKTTRQLAAAMGVSRRNRPLANTRIPGCSYTADLIQRGLITMQRRANKPAIYRLVPQKLRSKSAEPEP